MPLPTFSTANVTSYFNTANSSDIRSFAYDALNSGMYSAINSRFIVGTVYNDIINDRPFTTSSDALLAQSLYNFADGLDLANPSAIPPVAVTRDIDVLIQDNNGGSFANKWWIEIGGDVKRTTGGYSVSLWFRFNNNS